MTENEAASTRADEWLTVSQAAAALEISERTVRRRCENGKLAARLATIETGAAWEVSAAAVKAADGAATTADTLRPHSDSESVQAANLPLGKLSQAQAAAIAADSDLLAHLRGENTFLRGLIEQRDRAHAELMAAHRKALEAMPKQITGSEYSRDSTTQDGDEKAATTKVSGGVSNAAQSAPRRAPRSIWRVILGLR
jgi:hypothetical protein